MPSSVSSRIFIEQDQFRPHGQCPRNGNALLLAAGQLPWIRIGLVLHADFGEQFVRVLFGVRRRFAEHLARRDHQIFQNGQMREQVVLLEHEAHALAQFDALRLGIERVHIGVAHPDAAALGLQ
jgi:hypothetical protein